MGICKEIAGVCNFSKNVWGLDVYYGQVYISPKEMADYIRENDMYSVCQYLSEENKRDKPTLQIRYSNKDGFASALQNEFYDIYEYIINGNKNTPKELTGYLEFYTTDDLYTFRVVAVRCIDDNV